MRDHDHSFQTLVQLPVEIIKERASKVLPADVWGQQTQGKLRMPGMEGGLGRRGWSELLWADLCPLKVHLVKP